MADSSQTFSDARDPPGKSSKSDSTPERRCCAPKDPRYWGHILGWVAAGLGILSFGFIFQPLRFSHSTGNYENGFGICYGQPFYALFIGLGGAALQVVPLLYRCEKTRPAHEKASKIVNLWSKGIAWTILGVLGVIIAWSAAYPPFLDYHLCFTSTNEGDWCYDTPEVTLHDKLFSKAKEYNLDSATCQSVKENNRCDDVAANNVPLGYGCLDQCYPNMKTCPDIKSNGLCDSVFGDLCKSTCKPCIPNNIYCCNMGPPVYFGFAIVVGLAYFAFYILSRVCSHKLG